MIINVISFQLQAVGYDTIYLFTSIIGDATCRKSQVVTLKFRTSLVKRTYTQRRSIHWSNQGNGKKNGSTKRLTI